MNVAVFAAKCNCVTSLVTSSDVCMISAPAAAVVDSEHITAVKQCKDTRLLIRSSTSHVMVAHSKHLSRTKALVLACLR